MVPVHGVPACGVQRCTAAEEGHLLASTAPRVEVRRRREGWRGEVQQDRGGGASRLPTRQRGGAAGEEGRRVRRAGRASGRCPRPAAGPVLATGAARPLPGVANGTRPARFVRWRRTNNGRRGESVKIFLSVISRTGTGGDDNQWQSTEGNSWRRDVRILIILGQAKHMGWDALHAYQPNERSPSVDEDQIGKANCGEVSLRARSNSHSSSSSQTCIQQLPVASRTWCAACKLFLFRTSKNLSS